MGAGKQTFGELANFHKNAGKAPAMKFYAVKVNDKPNSSYIKILIKLLESFINLSLEWSCI